MSRMHRQGHHRACGMASCYRETAYSSHVPSDTQPGSEQSLLHVSGGVGGENGLGGGSGGDKGGDGGEGLGGGEGGIGGGARGE